MDKQIVKQYTNGEVTVKWQPHKCIHSTICFRGLPQVFDPSKRPWVDANGAATDEIIAQVSKCPSGALSYFMNENAETEVKQPAAVQIELVPNGPMLIRGDCSIRYSDGTESKLNLVNAFCRCGKSLNKPFCDGSHHEAGFRG